ncbi:MAG: hypothetical protein AAF481_07555 [Acidobacteriota bacterium]
MSRRLPFWLLLSTAFVALVIWLPPGLGDWRSQVLREWPDPGHPRVVTALAVTDGGERVASADAGGGVRVWSAQGEALRAVELNSPVEALAWDRSDHVLWLRTANGKVLGWSDDAPRPVAAAAPAEGLPAPSVSGTLSVPAQRGSFRIASGSPDDDTAAFSGDDGTVRLLLAGESSPRLLGAPVLTLAVSEDGRWLATGEGAGILGSGRVALYDRRSGDLRAALFLPDGPARCMRFSGEVLEIRQSRERSYRWRWGSEGSAPLAAADPLPCPGGEGQRFTVRSLGQVHGPEAALADRRHELLVELLPEVSRAREVRRRGVLDRFLGRVEWCGLRQDGSVVSVRSRPAQPLPAILFGAWLAALSAPLLAAKLSRRKPH